MIEAKDMNDNAILNATKVNIDGQGLRQLEIILPDGFKITSEWMKPQDADRSVVRWCQSVRDTFGARLEAKKEEARAQKMRASSGLPTTAPTTGERSAPAEEQPTSEHTDAPTSMSPEELVREQWQLAVDHLTSLRKTQNSILKELRKWEEARVKWATVAHSLKIELEERTNVDTTSEDGAEESDQRGSAGGTAGDLRDQRSDEHRAGGSGSEDRDAGSEQGDDQHDESGDDVG